jgi:hypothetical protein
LIEERLSPLFQHMPTQWMNALKQSFQRFTCQQFQTVESPVLREALPHLLGIQCLGVAYYANALVSKKHAATLEPLMFRALHYFDTASPHAVRLHGLFQREDSVLDVALENELEAILKQLEETVPDALVFSAKNQENAIQLVERLKQGLPICAVQHHDTAEIWHRLHALGLTEEATETPDYEALHEQGAIYQLMAHTFESPTQVREMMVALWLYRLETAHEALAWLEEITQQKDDNALSVAWQGYWASVYAQQQRSIKAVETAKLHHAVMGNTSVAKTVTPNTFGASATAPRTDGITPLASPQPISAKPLLPSLV